MATESRSGDSGTSQVATVEFSEHLQRRDDVLKVRAVQLLHAFHDRTSADERVLVSAGMSFRRQGFGPVGDERRANERSAGHWVAGIDEGASDSSKLNVPCRSFCLYRDLEAMRNGAVK